MDAKRTYTRPRGKAEVRFSIESDEAISEATRLFKSLADEHRLKILWLLSEHDELNVSAIGEMIGQSQPAVSHHLIQLRNAGLIEFRRDGKFNYYTLSQEGIHQLIDRVLPQGSRLSMGGVEFSLKVRK